MAGGDNIMVGGDNGMVGGDDALVDGNRRRTGDQEDDDFYF